MRYPPSGPNVYRPDRRGLAGTSDGLVAAGL
jgi:hypothetical protein